MTIPVPIVVPSMSRSLVIGASRLISCFPLPTMTGCNQSCWMVRANMAWSRGLVQVVWSQASSRA
jgi:hypothetical protein